MINIGDTVLATLDNYFFAPDGKQYRAVFGKVIYQWRPRNVRY